MNSRILIKEKLNSFQELLLAYSTGTDRNNEEYIRLREAIIDEPIFDNQIPTFILNCRFVEQFWQFMKTSYATYAERRTFIWDSFKPLYDAIEKPEIGALLNDSINYINNNRLIVEWKKAVSRTESDPEGAITMARTLLETTCKHILEGIGESYNERTTLSELYKKTAKSLRLAPCQYQEPIFKQILSGCQSVIGGLEALRNKLSDSHGKGKKYYKPSKRHAELAVNMAGSVAIFLYNTFESVKPSLASSRVTK